MTQGPEHAFPPNPAENVEKLPKVDILGNIGHIEPLHEIDTRNGKKQLFKLTVAVHPNPQDANETVWYTIPAFDEKGRQLQERFQNGEFAVGSKVHIAGRLKESPYTSRRTGQPGIDRQVFPYNAQSLRVIPPANPTV